MEQVHMTEAEVARDFAAVLARVRQGAEVVVEQDHHPVAIIKGPELPGHSLAEAIELAKAYEARLGYAPIPDPDFAADVQAGIDSHREPFDPPSWD